jgi:hypothetical protein
VSNRVRVVRANHGEPGRLSSEVARIVAALLPVVPASAVDLDDHAAFHQQINAANTWNRHLTLARQPSTHESDTNQRLDT